VAVSLPAALSLPACRLARWTVAHASALRTALEASDAHLRPWTPWVIDGKVPGLTLDERLARHDADFVAGREWVYGMFAPGGDEVLGGCGLYPRVGPNAVEIGYWLAAGHTGRGLATEAAGALTALAFAHLAVDQVEIRCEHRNAASARVPERLGYQPADAATAWGAPDLMVWRMTRDRFEARAHDTAAAARR
jgi:RimJ/RimL family protein N-acetyltransferase